MDDCLRSLFDFGIPSQEIIVVDNLSNDGTIEMIQQKYPTVKLILPETNLGFSIGNNEALKQAQGEFILLLNPDTWVKNGSLQTLMDYARKNENALIAPRLLNVNGSLQVSAWKFPMVLDSFMELFFLHIISKRNSYDLKNVDSICRVESVSGAAMLFSEKSFSEIGGLDETMFWMEDIDFCYRFVKMGKPVIYFPLSEIVHIGGESSKKNLNKAISNQLISKMKFFKKHHTAFEFYTLSLVIFLHILSRIACFQFLNLISKNEKAKAYRFTLKRFFDYLIKNDLSV